MIRGRLLRLLCVPPRPSAPEGDRQVQVLRASPKWFWYRMLSWAATHGAALIGLLIGLRIMGEFIPRFDSISIGIVTLSGDTMLSALYAFEIGAIVTFLTKAAGSLVLLRLDFEQRWYIVTDRSLRIREGLVRLREQTVTYANIQHVTVRQGPLQRLFGIADLQVRSAGGKSSGESEKFASDDKDQHVAQMRGINDPERIRDAIRERLRAHRDAGLGDPDDPEPVHVAIDGSNEISQPTSDLLQSAQELSREARLLRLALEKRAV